MGQIETEQPPAARTLTYSTITDRAGARKLMMILVLLQYLCGNLCCHACTGKLTVRMLAGRSYSQDVRRFKLRPNCFLMSSKIQKFNFKYGYAQYHCIVHGSTRRVRGELSLLAWRRCQKPAIYHLWTAKHLGCGQSTCGNEKTNECLYSPPHTMPAECNTVL